MPGQVALSLNISAWLSPHLYSANVGGLAHEGDAVQDIPQQISRDAPDSVTVAEAPALHISHLALQRGIKLYWLGGPICWEASLLGTFIVNVK